jgi:DNA-binding CsgD family transcriptional regulator
VTDWRDSAFCAQTDPEAFFPDKGGSFWVAKRICQDCEVRAECLADALATDDVDYGIRGGLLPKQRQQLLPPPPQPRVLHPERDAEIARLTRCGMTAREIAEQLGLTPRSVMRGRQRARRTAA